MAEGSDFSVEPKARTCWPKRAGVAAKHWSLGIKDLYIFAYKLLSVFLKSCKLHCEDLEQNGLSHCESKESPRGMKDEAPYSSGKQLRIEDGLGDSKEKHVLDRLKHSVTSKTKLCAPTSAGTTAALDLRLITMCDKYFFFYNKDHNTGLV